MFSGCFDVNFLELNEKNKNAHKHIIMSMAWMLTNLIFVVYYVISSFHYAKALQSNQQTIRSDRRLMKAVQVTNLLFHLALPFHLVDSYE